MLEIEKWAIDKPSVVAKIAQSLVLKSDAFQDQIDFQSKVAEQEFFQKQTNIPDWFDLYKNHKRVTYGIIEVFRSFGGLAREVADLYEFLLSTKKRTQPSREIGSISKVARDTSLILTQIALSAESNSLIRAGIENLVEVHQVDLSSDLSNAITEKEFQKVEKALTKPEFLFLLKVVGPCIAHYMEHPTRLYRKARIENIDSWDKLLRIDKLLICDPYINWRFARAYESNNYNDHNIMLNSSSKCNSSELA